MARPNDKDDVLRPLRNEEIEVRVYQGQTWAGAPMTEQPRLYVFGLEVAFEQDVVP